MPSSKASLEPSVHPAALSFKFNGGVYLLARPPPGENCTKAEWPFYRDATVRACAPARELARRSVIVGGRCVAGRKNHAESMDNEQEAPNPSLRHRAVE